MKKLFALLCLLLAVCASCACAEDEPVIHTYGNYEYILLADGTAEITNYSGKETDLTIPVELDGHPVSAIGDGAFVHRAVTCVTIPDSVTRIGANPFYSCTRLKSIQVSDTHPTLAVVDGVLISTADNRLVCYPSTLTATNYIVPQGITTIGDHAFYECKMLGRIILPDSLVTIEDYAFTRCVALSSIVLPDQVTSIGEKAFFRCIALSSIIMPSGITSIGDEAFYACRTLTSITLPDSLTFIGRKAFAGCEKLTMLKVSPDHPIYATINGVLFNKTQKSLVYYPCGFSAKAYTIPNGITRIEDYAFFTHEHLTSVTLPPSVTHIGDWAFHNCEKLSTVELTDGLTHIGSNAFAFCSALSRLDIPGSVTTIGQVAFSGCTALNTVTLPDSLTFIGAGAFYRCNALSAITVQRDSYAAQYCKANALPYTYPDANDWLMN